MTGFFVFGTLFRYFAKRFLGWVALCLIGLTAIVSLIQTVELVRRVSVLKTDTGDVNFIALALLNIPTVMEVVLPFAMLAGAMLCFSAWNKTNEFVVTRGFGHNIWISLSPAIASAMLVGLIFVVTINPIGSVTSPRYEQQMDRLFGSSQNSLTVTAEGIWLQDQLEDRRLIIHGNALDPVSSSVINPMIYSFGPAGDMEWRIRADRMQLTDSGWQISAAHKWDNEGTHSELGYHSLATGMNSLDLARSSSPPSSIAIFALPTFIGVLERTGLPTVEHRIHLHQLLALPILMVGIAMLGARFTLTTVSRGKKMQLFTRGVLIASSIFIFGYFMQIIGLSLRVPAPVAGWAPAIIVFLAGATSLARLDET